MDDLSLQRYSRHILLPQIDLAGQKKLGRSQALIIGLGGLGSPVALYLASSGIGHLVICDTDCVELSNLQRQIIHTTQAIGQHKTESAQSMLQALNPNTQITTISESLQSDTLHTQIKAADIVIDASDNFKTRFKINRACFTNKTPLISGAVIQMTGQATVFDSRNKSSPCYQCLYPDNSTEQADSCNASGVLAPATGIIGSIQAAETIKTLLDIGNNLCGRLLLIDVLNMSIRTTKLKKDPNCPVCS
ncbi:MAG: molybdopterin-synthase adenylyltransferase MoeB [Gammaproteobacteria bacterium]|nr:molybdopterin-synthase adenylyltransferase MoeB [Gammaproteobacteria bacterium]